MKTAIYLSNNIIRVITGTSTRGKVIVEQEISHVMPEGNLVNGVITNPQGLEQEIEELWKEYKLPRKNVYLVVHSSKFVSKQLTLPNVNKKKFMPMIPMEFTEVVRYEDAIYDYMKMPNAEKSGMQDLLGLVAERSFVEEYITLFARLGIKIVGFTNAIATMIKTLHYLKFLEKKTCIIQIMDESNLESVLWVNGEFVHSTNRRIIAEQGSLEFYTEVLRHTSSTVQFLASMERDEEISEAYICGATMEDVNDLSALGKTFKLGLEILPLDMGREITGIKSSDKIEDSVYVFGALINGKKDINLLKIYKRDLKSNHAKKMKAQRLIPIALIAGIGLVVTGVQMKHYFSYQKHLNELNMYLTTPENVNTALEADRLEAKIRVNHTAIQEAEFAADIIQSYPIVNKKVRDTIEKVTQEGVTAEITGYNSADGKLSLMAKATTEQAINGYITSLYQTNLFEDIAYTGYTYVEAEGMYSINVACYLSEYAGR